MKRDALKFLSFNPCVWVMSYLSFRRCGRACPLVPYPTHLSFRSSLQNNCPDHCQHDIFSHGRRAI